MPRDGGRNEILLMPIKTRETEGGGHAHLFTRDIIAAVRDLKEETDTYYLTAVIIAQNWSPSELGNIGDQIDLIFYFHMDANKFNGFDDKAQVCLNKHIEGILNNG